MATKFGSIGGKDVTAYVLSNSGITMKVIDFGATIVQLSVPDRDGNAADIVLGFDDIESYANRDVNPYFGAAIGRVGNRICKGKFTVDGKEYSLALNNGENALHGGIKGFDQQIWECTSSSDTKITFQYFSKDGEEGYPGNLTTTVTYELTAAKELCITYAATTDKATPVNLTNHSYFNLEGAASGATIEDHFMEAAYEFYTATDATQIPTGELTPVEGTPFDFREKQRVGDRMAQASDVGYDHNYVVKRSHHGSMAFCCKMSSPKTGRVMSVTTTEPGCQFYGAGWMDGTTKGKNGVIYPKHGGFCLETQGFPDAINQAKFPSMLLVPGEVLNSKTVYAFSTES